MVSELEARMLRALSLIDEDDAYDHLVKTKDRTARDLSDVVVAEGGIPWLTTEAELLELIPEIQRAAFHKAAAQRAAKLDVGVALPTMASQAGHMADPDGNANPAANAQSEGAFFTHGETAAKLMRKQTRGSGGKDFLGLWDVAKLTRKQTRGSGGKDFLGLWDLAEPTRRQTRGSGGKDFLGLWD